MRPRSGGEQCARRDAAARSPEPGVCLKENCCDAWIECNEDADCLCLLGCAGNGGNAVFCGLQCQVSVPMLLNTVNSILGECGLFAECGLAGIDCDDTDPFTFPGAAPDDDPAACMTDADEDDWGDMMPGSEVTPGTDCDDRDSLVHESCAPLHVPPAWTAR